MGNVIVKFREIWEWMSSKMLLIVRKGMVKDYGTLIIIV